MLSVIVVALVVVLIVWDVALRKRTAHTSALYPDLPLPPNVSFFALVQALITSKLYGTLFLTVLAEKHGPIVHVHVPFCGELGLLTDTKYAKWFFTNKDIDIFNGNKTFTDLVSPLAMKTMKSSVAPAITKVLSAERYTAVAPVLREEVTGYFENLLGKKQEISIDFFAEMRRLITIFMIRVFVGQDLQGKDMERFVDLNIELDLEDRFIHLGNIIKANLPSGKKSTELLWAEYVGIIKKIVDQRVATGNTQSDSMNYIISTNSQNGVIDYMTISIFFYMSVFAAATNTYATAAWTFLFMESNPDVKKAMLADKEEYLMKLKDGKDASPLLTNGTVSSTHAIFETVRHVAQGATVRYALNDVNVDDTYAVPKGWMFVMPYWLVFNNKEVFPNNGAYYPDRYKTEGKGFCETISFGAGRNPCTGAKLAQMAIKIVLYTMMEGYECEFKDDVNSLIPKSQPMGVYRPVRPCSLRLAKRVPQHA